MARSDLEIAYQAGYENGAANYIGDGSPDSMRIAQAQSWEWYKDWIHERVALVQAVRDETLREVVTRVLGEYRDIRPRLALDCTRSVLGAALDREPHPAPPNFVRAARDLLEACVEDMGYGDEGGDCPDSDDEAVALGSSGPSSVKFGHLRRMRDALDASPLTDTQPRALDGGRPTLPDGYDEPLVNPLVAEPGPLGKEPDSTIGWTPLPLGTLGLHLVSTTEHRGSIFIMSSKSPEFCFMESTMEAAIQKARDALVFYHKSHLGDLAQTGTDTGPVLALPQHVEEVRQDLITAIGQACSGDDIHVSGDGKVSMTGSRWARVRPAIDKILDREFTKLILTVRGQDDRALARAYATEADVEPTNLPSWIEGVASHWRGGSGGIFTIRAMAHELAMRLGPMLRGERDVVAAIKTDLDCAEERDRIRGLIAAYGSAENDAGALGVQEPEHLVSAAADRVSSAAEALTGALFTGEPRSDQTDQPDWTEKFAIDRFEGIREKISADPPLLSLLYDLDLLPEQLLNQEVNGDVTPGLVKAFHRFYGVVYAYLGIAEPLRVKSDGLRTQLDASAEMVRALEHQLAEAEKQIEVLGDLEMRDMYLADGGINVVAAGAVVERMALAMTAYFREGGSQNYVEMNLNSRVEPFERYCVTIQKVGAKSPAQKAREAEEERDRVVTERERYQTALYNARDALNDAARALDNKLDEKAADLAEKAARRAERVLEG